jgi:hypothetical protein
METAAAPAVNPTECWSDGVMGFPQDSFTPCRSCAQSANRKANDEPQMDTDGRGWEGFLVIRVHPRSSAVQIRNPQSAIRSHGQCQAGRLQRRPGRSRSPIRNPQSLRTVGRSGPEAAIRNSSSVSSQTQSNPVKSGQTGSNRVMALPNIGRRAWDSSGHPTYCGVLSRMCKAWWFAATAAKSAGRTLAIPASCPVKPSQTQSNHSPRTQRGVGVPEYW